ncbi:MAG: hypothetical protein QXL18_03815 [Candidatus Woesearchaeota archaeon]
MNTYIIKMLNNFLKKLRKLTFADFKYPIITILIMTLIFAIFTRSLKSFIGLSLGFIIIVYFPGYALSMLLLKDWDDLSKAIIALFIGMGPGPLIVYILSSFNINSLTITFSIILACISIIIIILCQDKKY